MEEFLTQDDIQNSENIFDSNIVLAVKKDQEKYAILFNKYYWQIRRFIKYRMLSSDRHSEEDVKDLTMIVFERVLSYILKNETSTPVKMLLYYTSKKLVCRYNYDYMNKIRLECEYPENEKGEIIYLSKHEKTVEQKYIEDEFKQIVITLLNKINKVYGDTGYMYFIEGYDEEEISNILKLPKTTIYKRVEICRNFIAKKLKNTRVKRCAPLKFSDEIITFIKNNHATLSLKDLHKEVCNMLGFIINDETLRKYLTKKMGLKKTNKDRIIKNCLTENEKEFIIKSIGRLTNYQVMIAINENRNQPIAIHQVDFLRAKYKKLEVA